MKKLLLLFILAFSLGINATETDSTKVDSFQKTDEVLSEVVKKALSVAEKTGEFVIEQAPDLLKEFYAWELWSNVSVIILMLLISYIIYFISKKIAENTDDKSLYIINLFQIFPLFFSGVSAYNVLFISIAPKLYLIKYFIK